MNFYEQPVAQNFMDTYAPLPFQEMAMLGEAYKREKDATEAAIDEFQSKYGDFTSLSQRDVESWDAQTFGKIRPELMQMAGDPEKIKSQEFQSGIRSAIRSVDASKLGVLKQSAENLKQRAAIIAQLRAQGKYKESWDPINIASWDSMNQGIMTDLSPLEYKSLHDIAAPYSQALKPSYLRAVDPYRYMVGVDENMIRNSLNTAASDIFSTPQGKAWYNDIATDLAKQGITDPEKVNERMMDMLVQSQGDYIHENLQTDDAALKKLELSSRYPNDPNGGIPRYTDQLKFDAMTRMLNMYKNASANGVSPKRVLSDVFNHAANKPDSRKTYNLSELKRGTGAIIDLLSMPTSRDGAESIIGQYASEVIQSPSKGKEFTFADSSVLENPTTTVASIASVGITKRQNDFDDALLNGAFTNVKVVPVVGNKAVIAYTDENNRPVVKQKVKVTFTENDIDFSKLDSQYREYDSTGYRGYKNLDKMLRVNGAKVETVQPEETNRYSESYDVSEGSKGKRTVIGDTKVSKSTSSKGKYHRKYTMELTIPVADASVPGESEMESAINNSYDRIQNVSSSRNKFYPGNVNASQGSIYED